jgi:hypothetical protein
MTSREETMCTMYREGRTLQEIGDRFGITRERVRQLIRPLGVTRADGGIHIAAVENQRRREVRASASREARSMSTYGCSYAEAKRLNYGMAFSDVGSPAFAYMRDRCNHTRRGKTFELTFPQWSDLFEAAGGVFNRGRFAEGLVLSLRDKRGNFVMGNVRVITLSENTRETRLQERQRNAA